MSLAVHCDRLFDGQEVHGPSLVTVEGDTVRAVEAVGEGDVNGRATHRCACLIPGLIDCHLHLAGYSESDPRRAPFQPMENSLRLLTLNGITTVRDTGNSIEAIRFARRRHQQENGGRASPRVFGTGPLLDVPPLVWPFSRIVTDPEAGRRQVSLLHAEGMDWIKSYRNIGYDELRAIVDEAGERDMDVAADVGAVTARQAAEIGVRSLEHAANLFDPRSFPELDPEEFGGAQGRSRLWSRVDLDSEAVASLVELLLEKGTFLCPTLIVSHRWSSLEAMVEEPYLDYMVGVMPYHKYFKRMQGTLGMMIGRRFMNRYLPVPKPSRRERRQIEQGLENLRRIVALLYRAGVKIAAGTDTPNPSVVPGFSLHQELELLVEGGLEPVEALRLATSSAAELLRQPDLGSVRPGARADLLLLDGDPTADITETMSIQLLLQGGEAVDREAVLEDFLSTFKDGS
ncbi:MAG: amidohydrolase family protein [Acidobacteriota bacterium]|nr:amidohydrolase family protein [Acidobacteriota bacterium]